MAGLADGTLHVWLAEIADATVAVGWLLVREQPGNFELPRGRVGILLDVCTLPEYRRNGIRTTIMQRLIEEARGLQLDRLELRATKDGEPVYRRLGFTEPTDRTLELSLRP